MNTRVTRRALVEFHTAHKYQLLAHSRPHYQELGRLVAAAQRHAPLDVGRRYGTVSMEGLKARATARKHVNVLHHLVGHFTGQLVQTERTELIEMIEDYRRGLIP